MRKDETLLRTCPPLQWHLSLLQPRQPPRLLNRNDLPIGSPNLFPPNERELTGKGLERDKGELNEGEEGGDLGGLTEDGLEGEDV
jgi:hypothetical protein